MRRVSGSQTLANSLASRFEAKDAMVSQYTMILCLCTLGDDIESEERNPTDVFGQLTE